MHHKGDNWEGDWQTEMKLIDPAAPIEGSKKGGKKSKGGLAARGTKELAPGEGYKVLTKGEIG